MRFVSSILLIVSSALATTIDIPNSKYSCSFKEKTPSLIQLQRDGSERNVSKQIALLKKKIKKLKNSGGSWEKIEQKRAKLVKKTKKPLKFCRGFKPKYRGVGVVSLTGLEPAIITPEIVLEGRAGSYQVTDASCTFSIPEGFLEVSRQGCRISIKAADHRTKDGLLHGESSIGIVFSILLDVTNADNFLGDRESLAAYKDKISDEEVSYLVNRVYFGANLDEALEINRTLGLDSLIEWMLTKRSCPQIDSAIWQKVSSRGMDSRVFEHQGKNGYLERFWVENIKDKWYWRTANMYLTQHMRYGCNPIRDRFAVLFANQFSVDIEGSLHQEGLANDAIEKHIKLIRSEFSSELVAPLGEIIKGMHLSHPMNRMLGNNQNSAIDLLSGKNPNENYARELLELHSLSPKDSRGGKNYHESTIQPLAQSLLGPREVEKSPIQREFTLCCRGAIDNNCPALPDQIYCTQALKTWRPLDIEFQDQHWNNTNNPFQRTLFQGSSHEQTRVWSVKPGSDNLTNYILSHPGASDFMARKLLATFTVTDPSVPLVEELSNLIKSENFNFTKIMSALLRASVFYSKESRFSGIRNPVHKFVAFTRALSLPAEFPKDPLPGRHPDTIKYPSGWEMAEFLRVSQNPIITQESIFGLEHRGHLEGHVLMDGSTQTTESGILALNKGFSIYIAQLRNEMHMAMVLDPTAGNENNIAKKAPIDIIKSLAFKTDTPLGEEEVSILVEYLTTVKLESGEIARVNYDRLSHEHWLELMAQKIPGLLEALFLKSLKGA